jgi:DNA primase
VLNLLQQKDISKEILKEFNIGYFDGTHLYGNLPKIIYGLKKGWNFTPRIIFPIYNMYKELIAIAYRTPNLKIFYENSIPLRNNILLYGIHKTYPFIIQSGEVIIVEGIFDLLSMYQYGIKNVICNLGTSVNYYKMLYVSRFAQNILLAFDNDSAGREATKNWQKIAIQQDLHTIDLNLPSDPDDFIKFLKKEGFELWIKFCKIGTQNYPTTQLKITLKEKLQSTKNTYSIPFPKNRFGLPHL